jgi:hypothetical protein
MPEPKYAKGMKVKVNNRDLRKLVWYPKLEQYHGQIGTVVDSEYWSTYFLPGDTEPTDVFNYTIEFSGMEKDNMPQMILEPADQGK